MPRLEARLDEWAERAAAGAAHAGLEPVACALLEEAERRLADGRAPARLWHRCSRCPGESISPGRPSTPSATVLKTQAL